MMTKVMWVSNAPFVPSAYGRQTKLIAATLPDLGHELAIYCNYGLRGAKQDAGRFIMYPADAGMKTAVRHFQPDVIVSFYDPWAENWTKMLGEEEFKGVPWVSWYPVDTTPASLDSVRNLEKHATEVVAMSRFGQDVLSKYHDIDATYIPCGEDFDSVFIPYDKYESRKMVGLPKRPFIFGMVGNNQGVPNRKGFLEAMVAFKMLLDTGANAVLYLHTIMDDSRKGLNLWDIARYYEIPEDRLWYSNQNKYRMGEFNEVYLARLYSSFDFLLQPTYAEGFGIPVIEAQGCETPVLASNNTTMPELVRGGMLFESQDFPHPHSATYNVPIIKDIYAKMQTVYDMRESVSKYEAMGKAGRAHILENFNWKTSVVPRWDDLLKRYAK